MTFKQASVYALKKLSDEERLLYGLRVLTMRKWPRGIKRCDIDLWMPTAGPSPALLEAVRTGEIIWEQFAASFCAQQQDQQVALVVTYPHGEPERHEVATSSLEQLRALEREYGTVTVLCWERDAEHCHRHLLLARLSERERP